MSMGMLSTELDNNVAQHLVIKELSALSRTFKYYRALAEPHLYKDVLFSTEQIYRIWFLLCTIVQRPSLAEHIRSFTLTREPVLGPSYAFMQDEDEEL